MKAWFVIGSGADYGAFVWAGTRNRAKRLGIDHLEHLYMEYLSTKATRYPALDDPEASEGVVPKETCFRAGCSWICEECEGTTDGGGAFIDGEILCESCASVTCPTCKGTGGKGDEVCERCDGYGFVLRSATDCSELRRAS